MLDTTRRVATPEGIELTLRLAGPVPRALAWAIDFALRVAAGLAVMMVAPPFHLDLEEQRAVLELAERSASLTRERLEELAELPGPLVGRLDGARAAAHLIGMANYLLGRK